MIGMDDRARRESMVATQIVARGVRDPRIVAAMRDVPRHRFVPEAWRDGAYDDRPLPIGEGQTISQPYMVAIMSEALDVSPTHRVLEIGTGSGYQAAILGALAREVISIERHDALAAAARAVLGELGIANVEVVVGDGTEGYAAGAPYDRILVTAGAPVVPETLKHQLADAGRLIIPVGTSGFQHLVTIDRSGDTFMERTGVPCVFVPLVGRHGWPP
jgi:protein-L-isoaspartate(D-aspartate) O-methyltransferase